MHVSETEPVFDLSGGALCLDFANTLDDRPSSRPNDFLRSYADLVAFGQQTGTLTELEAAGLLDAADRRPADAASALARAIDLREVIYRLFVALADGRPVPPTDLAALNGALAEGLAHARVVEGDVSREIRFGWAWTVDPLDLDRPTWPVTRSAADLLTTLDLRSLRLCASESCAWLFLDTSRNGSRRWCSMRTCGNRAKARRHHARVKAGSTSS
jgi:predicted RNA-binding Zn ribbon-like protein